jgi:hypothetical protein
VEESSISINPGYTNNSQHAWVKRKRKRKEGKPMNKSNSNIPSLHSPFHVPVYFLRSS